MLSGPVTRLGGSALLICVTALVGFSLNAAPFPLRVWEVAKARPAVPGAPKYGDVTVRNLRPHPHRGKRADPYDTFQMARDFHITRLEWTYGLDREFVQKARAMGLTVGGALEDAEEDANGSMKLGRVTGQDGKLKTHPWFHPERFVGCANSPEFRAAWQYQARRYVDAGVDLMQQDDPQMSTRTAPPFCYCAYCSKAFTAYQEQHGRDASYEQFQQESILQFHREMHGELDAYAGRRVPFSHNNLIGFRDKLDWTAPAFDFINAEIEGDQVHPVSLQKKLAASGGMPMVFSYRDTSVANNRRALATLYAAGAWMLLPWDVYMPNNAPRYFGRAEDYADLSGFIRGNARFLDGYEAVTTAGTGMKETRFGASTPVKIGTGSGEAYAFVRAQPGQAAQPIVIHLIEWASVAKPFTLRLRVEYFSTGGNLTARLRLPTAYDPAVHRIAQERGEFSSLCLETPVTVVREGDFVKLSIPALNPWGILVIEHD